MIALLRARLDAIGQTRRMPFTVHQVSSIELLVCRSGGHGVGIWRASGNAYEFTLLGGSTPVHVAHSIAAAVEITLAAVSAN